MADEFSFSFTAAAENDLDETLTYISKELSAPISANTFLKKLEDRIDLLRKFPFSCSVVGNPFVKRNDIRKTPVGNFILYYVPDPVGREIVILRIVYGPRDRETIEREL